MYRQLLIAAICSWSGLGEVLALTHVEKIRYLASRGRSLAGIKIMAGFLAWHFWYLDS
jgi:hypothetical protein